MQLFYQANIVDGINLLNEEESRHIQKALRLTVGDTIRLTDGKGYYYEAQLAPNQGRSSAFKVLTKTLSPAPKHSIHIAIAPTKNADRIEWFVEKVVELGIQQISFISCDNSERKTINLDRIEKKAISAMKQSGQYHLPMINELIPFKQFAKTVKEEERFIGFVDEENPHHLKDLAKSKSSYVILIGPEGDFSEAELNLSYTNNFKKVSLGSTRLRTETAGIAACHILNLVNTQSVDL
jgi:16S rRNA (uracil1498-N3)-methyltransferase